MKKLFVYAILLLALLALGTACTQQSCPAFSEDSRVMSKRTGLYGK